MFCITLRKRHKASESLVWPVRLDARAVLLITPFQTMATIMFGVELLKIEIVCRLKALALSCTEVKILSMCFTCHQKARNFRLIRSQSAVLNVGTALRFVTGTLLVSRPVIRLSSPSNGSLTPSHTMRCLGAQCDKSITTDPNPTPNSVTLRTNEQRFLIGLQTQKALEGHYCECCAIVHILQRNEPTESCTDTHTCLLSMLLFAFQSHTPGSISYPVFTW